jgi:cell division septum initiation protein DivIVA
MKREEIVRNDFPRGRRGYDPDAVREHLEAVRQHFSLSGIGERATEVLEVAERKAAEFEEEARHRMDEVDERVRRRTEEAEQGAVRIEQEARREAERILGGAHQEAQEHVKRAQVALERLVGEAEELRSSLGVIGREVLTELQGTAAEPVPLPAAQGTERASEGGAQQVAEQASTGRETVQPQPNITQPEPSELQDEVIDRIKRTDWKRSDKSRRRRRPWPR